MIPATLVCALAFQPNTTLDRRLDVSLDAMPTTQVVAALAKQTGLPLAADPALWRDVVQVQADDVLLRDLLDRLARLTASEWTMGSGGYRLSPSTRRQAEQRQAQAGSRARDLLASKRRWIEGLSSPPALAPGDTSMLAQVRNPAGRLFVRLVEPIGVEALLPDDDRPTIVFSSNPGGRALPFPGGFDRALQGWRDEFRPSEEVAGVRLAVALVGEDTIGEVLVLGKDGAVLDEARGVLEYGLGGVVRRWMSRAGGEVDWAVGPDPTSSFLTDYARRQGKKLIALVPDALTLGPAPRAYLDRIVESSLVLERAEQGPWLELTPTRPAWSRARRLPKAELDVLSERRARLGRLPLADRARFAAAFPEVTVALTPPLVVQGDSPQGLRLYGLLGSQALDVLARGRPWPLASWSPEVRSVVEGLPDRALDAGLPEDATLSLSVSQAPAAFSQGSDGWRWEPDVEPAQAQGVGSLRRVTLTLRLGGPSVELRLNDPVPPPSPSASESGSR